ncbi:RelE cytotoxic translational repressor of toxin-antitoxin stability system [Endozoicomonas montiporae]|uniref:RelE cytotoxic translational repressor of toxin-antitoxin stability system n=2 Tax=Endozoicomonas montiporae TaxID=1027273 RepID=A0A081MYJ9_9GAMM|nr:RelE cytotoxic translational repressor of toxin-antitoxin stability system [Endozoicomonas montiporae]
MHTVVELPHYRKRAEHLLSASEREDIIRCLADSPTSGDLIRETGGVRKLRWKRGGSGKSGGVRVIYFYHNEGIPLFLLTVYGKNEQDNLTKAQKHEMRKVTEALVKQAQRQQKQQHTR